MQPPHDPTDFESEEARQRAMRAPLFRSWGQLEDESVLQRRRWINRTRIAMLVALVVTFVCLLSLTLMGQLQSFAAQAIVTVPHYPGAERTALWVPSDCGTGVGVYCQYSLYQTSDPVEKVIAYYTKLTRPSLLPQIRFYRENGKILRGDYVISRICADFWDHTSCTAIVVVPQDAGAKVYYLELGFPKEYPPTLW